MASEAPKAPKQLTAPSREGVSKFKVTWNLGSGATSGDGTYDGQTVDWDLKTRVKTADKYGKASYVDLKKNSVSKRATQNTVSFNRKHYYPCKTTLLLGIRAAVTASNNVGSATVGPKEFSFAKPKKPTIEASYEESSGLLTVEISAPGDAKHDCYDCQYNVYRQDKRTQSSRYKDGKRKLALDRNHKTLSGTSKKSEFKLYSDVETVYLKDGASITFTITAMSRGYAGNSDTNTVTLVISSPIRAEITKVDVTNKDKLGISKNLLRVSQADGSVLVYYKSAEGPQNAEFDKREPNKYTLQRAITPYNVNTVIKAELFPDWVDDIDTNEGATSETKAKYSKKKKAVPRYSGAKLSTKAKVQYYTAKDVKTNRTTPKWPAWQLSAHKKAVYKVGKKNKHRYTNITPVSKANLNVFKAYNCKTKKWETDIPAYLKTEYAKKTFVKAKGGKAKLYKNWTKTSSRPAKYYECVDRKTAKTVKNVPEWNLKAYSKDVINVPTTKAIAHNPSDGVMGEPLIDVFQAMGFGASGGVYDKRVWYRIKCERYGIPEYSRAFEAVEFRAPAPTAKKDYAGFTRLIQSPYEPGTAILGTVAWNNADKTDEGVDNPNWKDAQWTTIVEYSKYKYASKSNEKAAALEIDWHNSAATHKTRQKDYCKMVAKGDFTYKKSNGKVDKQAIKWKSSADFAIYGLEPGVPIYLRVRRHMVLGEFDELGPATTAPTVGSGYYPFTPIDNPSAVVVFVPEYCVKGEGLTVSWGHNAVCPQKSWTVYVFPADKMDVYHAGKTNVKSIPKKIIAAGTGTKSSYTIPASELENLIGKNKVIFKTSSGVKKAFSVIKNLGILVGVSTGGAEILSCQDSKKKYVDISVSRIILPPTCYCWAPEKYTKIADRKIFVFTNSTNITGAVSIYARDDVSLYYPDKTYRQSEGECVWNYAIAESDFIPVKKLTSAQKKLSGIQQYVGKKAVHKCAYVAVVSIPAGVKELYNNCSYTIEAHTISKINSSYISNKIERMVQCIYNHAAKSPSYKTKIVRDFAVSKNVKRYDTVVNRVITPPSLKPYMGKQPTVAIYCLPPSNYKSTDRCNVYRVTPDSCDLIAENVLFNRIVIDRYAPFSTTASLRYIIATVTAEGRMAWREKRYSYPRHGMRFDWGDFKHPRAVELPFDIELNPSYEKQGRITTHMDGTVQAYFNPGITKTESVSTKLVRLGNPYQFELVKELAQYSGTCFFRAHDGSAYECVVKVSGIANSFDSQVAPVSLELTRVTLSDRFKPRKKDIVTKY